jgi:hypothetical protein
MTGQMHWLKLATGHGSGLASALMYKRWPLTSPAAAGATTGQLRTGRDTRTASLRQEA